MDVEAAMRDYVFSALDDDDIDVLGVPGLDLLIEASITWTGWLETDDIWS